MNFSIVLKGMAMGVAEAIPGVSGGTIAFITGIYERLLAAIGGLLSPKVLGVFRKDGAAAAWRAADGTFLLSLAGGMVVGLGVAVVAITSLLEHYPPVVWAFFFGLIVSSAVYVARQIDNWGLSKIALLLAGGAVAYLLTTINPLAGSTSPIMVFFSGMVAISALILPGISGSFILVLLGMYTVVFGALRSLAEGQISSLVTVGAFALGCLVGLAAFARLLTWTFKTYPDRTFAVLTGFMLGSLNKLWPWRNALTTRVDSGGDTVAVLEAKVLPADYTGLDNLPDDPYVLASICALIAGLAIVFVLEAVSGDDAQELAIAEDEILEETKP